uniref:Uncharacterized protein n=1 Tax=Cacopsylla melanoneura TaxID=428564 RepID=A0A8D8Y2L3_9HEMI
MVLFFFNGLAARCFLKGYSGDPSIFLFGLVPFVPFLWFSSVSVFASSSSVSDTSILSEFLSVYGLNLLPSLFSLFSTTIRRSYLIIAWRPSCLCFIMIGLSCFLTSITSGG